MLRFFTTAILAYSLLISAQENQSPALSTRTVVIIPVTGNVEPAMAAFISRALREHSSENNPVFLLEMDTFGGRVDAALQIADTLLSVKNGMTVAFVKNKAISAGALIALACNHLAMKHNTTIGDCAPITMSQEGPKMLGEKFQSPLRAQFRTMAKRNNYPQALAESMVTEGMVVYKVTFPDTVIYMDSLEFSELSQERKRSVKSKNTIVGPGQLLTMDDKEAKEYGFSMMSADNIEQVLAGLGISDYNIRRFEESWSETFVRFISSIAPILMMIGFAALYTEMKTPGFGIPGIVGVVCLGLVFAGQYLVGLADYTEILFIALGAALLAVELFITPGFGMTGIAGLLLMAFGMILSMQGFVLPSPEFPWQRSLFERNILTVLASLTGSFVLILLFFRFILPQMSRVVHGPYLSATLAQAHADSDTSIHVTAGQTGVVVKPLRPSGNARIGDRIYDVITNGEFIDAGERIAVETVRGTTIIVSHSEENNG